MKIHSFLEHHGIVANPFADEEAQTDPVFKEHCIITTHHPSWDKIYGNPSEPSTSIVFGEKGAGKTALRLQIVRQLREYNQQHPDQQIFVIQYDDFNPFLDRFRARFRRWTSVPKVLGKWQLWDHMDAILSLGVTQLADMLLGEPELPSPEDPTAPPAPKPKAAKFDRPLARDMLLLAACYDQSTRGTFQSRWHQLRSKLRFWTWSTYWDRSLGLLVLIAVMAVTFGSGQWSVWLAYPWLYLLVAAAWIPALVRVSRRWWLASGIVKNVRVGNRETGPLRRLLMHFTEDELSGQPLPTKPRTDDRYELLIKFQTLIKKLGYAGIVVLVDRLDEPDLIAGSAEKMRALLWPLLDNKFLKQPGFGVKLLLPIELTHFIDREDTAFYQRSRLDKQNMVRSLEWTGEALFDIANARLKACAKPGTTITLRELFAPEITNVRLLDVFRSLRVPRHLFQFMYRLLVVHCNAHTDDNPSWQIKGDTFESTLAIYRRDQETFERGMKAG